jgi:hypothetical protein
LPEKVIGIKGKIAIINKNNGLIAVQTEQGDYSVMGLIGGYDVELGDEVTGDLRSSSGESIENLTQYETMDVSIEASGLNLEQARAMLKSLSS